MTKKLLKIVIVIISFLLLICVFPMILDIIFLIRDRDIIINHTNYKKKNVVIDSLSFNNPNGSDATRIDGYSKELDNYKTMIIFGQTKDNQISNKTKRDENGIIKTDIWYREKSKYAYPATATDFSFPINKFLYSKLSLPIIWIVFLIINFLLYKKIKKLT
ncbi:hypothetical protein [Chryseobacterium sp.]|uniref:hypothetical protein n=1 Tax=Chryseobacterium sp. TaxID=1871047 RepID=UPI002FCC6E78